MLPAVSIDSMPATTMWVKVEVNRRNCWVKSQNRKPRMWTELVGIALL